MVVIFADTDKVNFRIFLFIFVLAFVPTASALDYVHFRHLGKERNEEGRILFRAPDGIAFESRAGQCFVISRSNLISRSNDDVPFTPYTKSEMLDHLKREFPPKEGFQFLDTFEPFIIVYTTEKPFAVWYANLLQKVHEKYVDFWERLDVKLTKPEFLMVAIVLTNEEQLRQYAKRDGADLLKGQCAYYHKLTNRIAVYDMSGRQGAAATVDVRRLLTDNIVSVAHEAVHQVGFSTGMHIRFAPCPTWLCEGLAVMHEVADPKNRLVGWSIGLPHVNRPRLNQLNQYMAKPHQESPIQRMIKTKGDDLFRQANTALDHYALAWGLTYYLVKKRPKELAAYLAIQQTKTAESEDDDAIRMADFESCFGNDWDKFHKEFLAFLKTIK